ncbi:MAG: ABC transporter substrate-binding protein, partial [Thermodesulfobacteriota bacterium]|nr:ABC transporter substrate-binding protein [Thermodesulfobacteriota bacterium]
MKKLCVPLVVFVFLFGLSPVARAKTIKIGGIMDTTGATSDVGKDYAIGMAEAFHYLNDMGGVNGKKIKYRWFDYGYRIPEALTKYKLLKRMKVIAVMGWGTGDTEALSPTINKDKMPYVSASYSAHLTRPVDWVGKD